MDKIKDFFTKLLSSKIVHYIFTSYFGYFLQFVNSLLLANYLGVFYLGVYGFITLVIQYLSYGNFGTQYALNFYLSTKNSKNSSSILFSNTVLISFALAAIILLTFLSLHFFDIDLFSKYSFGDFYILIAIIGVLQIVNQLFVNIYRTYGMLGQINFHQIIVPLLQIFGFLFFDGLQLLYYILFCAIAGFSLSLILFLLKNPIEFKPEFKFKIVSVIFKKGLNLLIYNISFYLIMLSGRTMVGIFYSVEDMGQYSFGSNLANAVMMIMNSMGFLFFSKMVNRLSGMKITEEISAFIDKSRAIYINMTLITGFVFLITIPYLEFFLPQYSLAFLIFKYLMIAQIILANVFGYSTLLIVKKKEFKLTVNAILTVVINLILSSVIIIGNYNVIYIALITCISVIFYNLKSIYDSNSFTQQFSGLFSMVKHVFPLKITISLILIFLATYLDQSLFLFMGFLYYIIFNLGELKSTIQSGYSILINKDSLKL